MDTPAASVILQSALCMSYLPLSVTVRNDKATPKAKSSSLMPRSLLLACLVRSVLSSPLSCSSKTLKPKVELRAVLLAKKYLPKKPWCLCPRASEGSPRWGSAVYTYLYGARLSLVPSGDSAVNPATAGASGHSGLQRVHPVSARKRSGSGGLLPQKILLLVH